MRRFENQVAIVTGAGSGIGAASATRLASEGATVVVADVDAEAAKAVAAAIENDGGAAAPAAVDVGDRQAVDELVAGTLSAHGRLDVMVNNAGIGAMVPISVIDQATIDRLLAVNVKGVLNGTAAAAVHMLEAGRGAIVNTSSAAAVFGSPLQVVYAATKGAVLAATKSAAMELAPHVRVNAVCPGGVVTAFVATTLGFTPPPEFDEAAAKVHPLGRMADPAEIAACVAFLASDDASFVTGIGLPVDGGMTAGARIDLV